MKLLRLAPFLILPSLLQASDDSKKVENPPAVSKEDGNTKTEEAPKVIDVKLKGLTDEENKALSQALSEIRTFFKKHTKDKPYNHKIISDLSPDLKFDLDGLKKRAEKMPEGIERSTLEAYPDPDSGLDAVVETIIESTAQSEFERLFKYLGVVNKPDDKKGETNTKINWNKLFNKDKPKPVEERVKIADLEIVEQQLRLVKLLLDKSLDREVTFPGGVTVGIIEAIQKGNIQPLIGNEIVFLPKEKEKIKN